MIRFDPVCALPLGLYRATPAPHPRTRRFALGDLGDFYPGRSETKNKRKKKIIVTEKKKNQNFGLEEKN